ncbi:MAG: CPBP family intramembrane glutamic endopeptidase [Candidatus Micrarchaeia archaeon]
MEFLPAVIVTALGLIFAGYYALRSRLTSVYWKRVSRLFNLRFEKPFNNILLPALAAVLLQLGLFAVFGFHTQQNTLEGVAGLLFLSAFCAPIWEESVFRGAFLEFLRFKGAKNNMILIFFLAALFTLAHDYAGASALAMASHFTAGLLFGFLYVRENNLLPAIIAHGAGNAVIILASLA